MKKQYLLTGILVVISCLLLLNCVRKDMQKDFASFDRAYIPALALTNQGKIEQSQKAMVILKENWKNFKYEYYRHKPKQPGWGRDFDYVEQLILKADEIVNKETDLLDAHELLEDVRFKLMEMRKRNNIDYYIDYLTEFHEPMEAIVLTAKGKTPENLSDADIEKIQEFLAEASSILSRLEKAKFDAPTFGFTDEKTGSMRDYVKLESESLDKLEQSIESKDKRSIIQSAMGVKPNFVKLYFLFGDFGSIE